LFNFMWHIVSNIYWTKTRMVFMLWFNFMWHIVSNIDCMIIPRISLYVSSLDMLLLFYI
jgi:hypothetical protein